MVSAHNPLVFGRSMNLKRDPLIYYLWLLFPTFQQISWFQSLSLLPLRPNRPFRNPPNGIAALYPISTLAISWAAIPKRSELYRLTIIVQHHCIRHSYVTVIALNLGHRDIEFHRDIDTPLHQKHPTLERYTNNTECDTEEMTFRQTVACVEQRNS